MTNSPSKVRQMSINNIGPHSNLTYLLDDKGNEVNKTAISNFLFALNGNGKTFISRCFKLLSDYQRNVTDIESSAQHLIQFGEKRASFDFEYLGRSSNFILSEGLETQFEDQSGLIFHVFNSDYIQENLLSTNFVANSDINGYIAGRENIDLSSEKHQLELLENQMEVLTLSITSEITDHTKMLKSDFKIAASLGNFKKISFDNVFNSSLENNEYEKYLRLNTLYSSLPAGTPSLPTFEIDHIIKVLNHSIEILETEYNISKFSEDFKKYIKENLSFIENGVHICDSSNLCPFCKQNLSEDSLALIEKYRQFINDKEAKTIKEINYLIERQSNVVVEIENILENSNNTIERTKILSNHINTLSIPNNIDDCLKDLIAQIEEISKLLLKKRDEISIPILVSENLNKTVNSFVSEISEFNKVVLKDNAILEKPDTYRKEIQNELCAQSISYLSHQLQNSFQNLRNIRLESISLKNNILEKELQIGAEKKDVVRAVFTNLLDSFFDRKYTLDPDSFTLVFNDNFLVDNASRVLSDGEKSIVSFCYYIASTHTLVNSEDDYDNIMFIIDDPVSSMDFQYSYQVIQIIKSLKRTFNQTTQKTLVLSHNLELTTTMIGNNSLKHCHLLANNEIVDFHEQIKLPYHLHLSDIVRVGDLQSEPDHTTPNSMRHILETMQKFEGRTHLSDFQDEVEFESCQFFPLLCNDLSHGKYRIELSTNPESIIKCCNSIKLYIESRYPGQLR